MFVAYIGHAKEKAGVSRPLTYPIRSCCHLFGRILHSGLLQQRKYFSTASIIWSFIVMSRSILSSLRRLCSSGGITTVTLFKKTLWQLRIAYRGACDEPDSVGIVLRLSVYGNTSLQFCHATQRGSEIDCAAMNLSLSVLLVGFYSIQVRNKSYKC